MHSGNILRAFALVVLLGASPAAMSQSTGFYVLGAIGYADHRADLMEFNRTYALADERLVPMLGDVPSLSDSTTAFKIALGYRFHQNFAIEGAYGRLGKVTYSVFRPDPEGGTFEHQIKPEAAQLSVLGIFPVNPTVEVFGKAGVAYIDNKGSIRQTGGPPVPAPPCGPGIVCLQGDTTDDWAAVLGVGLNFNLQSRLFVRAELEGYTHYKVSTAPDLRPLFGPLAQTGGDIKITSLVWSLGLGYRF